MKKWLCYICALLMVFAVAGCTPNDAASDSDGKATEDFTLPPEIKKMPVEVSWVIYGNLEDLVGEASNIFEGKVTNISFGVFLWETGEPMTPGVDDPKDGMLFTIYEVKVTHSYKGENDATVFLRIPGGLEGYREEEQIIILQQAGVTGEYLHIPIWRGVRKLNIGDSYLFLTKALELHHVPVFYQCAYSPDNSEVDYFYTYDQIKEYLLQHPAA